MQKENSKEDNFVKIKCYICGKVLFEASPDATGEIRKKCDSSQCKQLRIISLPLNVKKANLQPARA